MDDLAERLVQGFVPVRVSVRYTDFIQKYLNVILNNFPVDLHRQHQIGKDVLGHPLSKSCLEDGLKLLVFSLSFPSELGFLISD